MAGGRLALWAKFVCFGQSSYDAAKVRMMRTYFAEMRKVFGTSTSAGNAFPSPKIKSWLRQ
jgi:hypothetical protein